MNDANEADEIDAFVLEQMRTALANVVTILIVRVPSIVDWPEFQQFLQKLAGDMALDNPRQRLHDLYEALNALASEYEDRQTEQEEHWIICPACCMPLIDPTDKRKCEACGSDFHPECLGDHQKECQNGPTSRV